MTKKRGKDMATRINFTLKLHNLDGSELIDAMVRGDEVKPVTLRDACKVALVSVVQGDTPEQKFENYRLALRIENNDELDLTAEEITMLKKRVGIVLPPLHVGNVWMILDPPPDKE